MLIQRPGWREAAVSRCAAATNPSVVVARFIGLFCFPVPRSCPIHWALPLGPINGATTRPNQLGNYKTTPRCKRSRISCGPGGRRLPAPLHQGGKKGSGVFSQDRRHGFGLFHIPWNRQRGTERPALRWTRPRIREERVSCPTIYFRMGKWPGRFGLGRRSGMTLDLSSVA